MSAVARSSSSAPATASASRSARHSVESVELFLFGLLVDDEDVRLFVERLHERGVGRLGEAIHTDHRDLARLDPPHPLGVALHQPLLHRVDHGEGAPAFEHPGELGLGGLGQLRGLLLHHVGAGEQVVVLEEVGLEGQHLLDAERPLLVPRAGQAQRLVPRGQLDRTRPRVV